MTVSIIIVNYKSQDNLKNCLKSIFQTHFIEKIKEVIIVNNDETNDLTEIKSLYPQLKLINHQKNLGFGAGINLGAKIAQGKILWFLNPDCEIIPRGFGAMLDQFSDLSVAILGTALVDNNRKIQEWTAGYESSFFEIVLNNLNIIRSKKIWESKKIIKCDWVSGASFLIKKNLFKKANGFDETFFMYFEDMDLCKRMRALGYKVIFYPLFIVSHIGGGSYLKEEKDKKQKEHFYKSQDYYFKKHYSQTAFLIKFLRKLFGK